MQGLGAFGETILFLIKSLGGEPASEQAEREAVERVPLQILMLMFTLSTLLITDLPKLPQNAAFPGEVPSVSARKARVRQAG